MAVASSHGQDSPSRTRRRWRTVAALAVLWAAVGCGSSDVGGADSGTDSAADQTDDTPVLDTGDALQGLDLSGGDGGLNCPGGPQCPCSSDSECDNGLCIDGPPGKRCAVLCESGGCDQDAICAKVNSASGDIFSVCVPRWGFLCEPCTASAQCAQALAISGATCMRYGDEAGAFCGAACQTSSDCPGGYSCENGTTIEGQPTRQCQKSGTTGEPGLCACDGRATALQLTTACIAKAELGTCKGFRQCGAAGLSACSAPKPSPETCDNVDNDCNGLTDENLCDDKNPCTDDQCLSASQSCQNSVNTVACNDGSACTEKDVCAGGKCAGSAFSCDDKNVCTTDVCDPAKGCVYNPIAGQCDDGDDCTVGDNCKEGACSGGKPKDCDDGNPCTQDGCDIASGKCASKILDGAPCSDGNACTTPDTCVGDVCKGGPVDCNDKNPCTDDACDPTKGCTNLPNTLGCDDGNACTKTDTCDGKGGCSGTQIDVAVVCNDNNICTADVCDQASGCANTPQAGPCDDGDPCSNGDQCNGGVCKGGANICACQQDSDCPDANLCDGQLFCDKAKAPYVCAVKAGSVPQPCDQSQDNPCSVSKCQPATGLCGKEISADGKACNADDSVCTQNDTCKNGFCAAGAKLPCDDNNPCTDDLCDAKDGCKNVANVAPCEDGNQCTSGDACAGSKCVAGKAKDCDDKSDCTLDSCLPATGACVNDPSAFEGGPCNADNSVCTVGDKCSGGVCKAGVAKNCDDSNVCTTDSCDAAKGCVNVSNTGPCEYDNNACTPNDVCKNGECTLGPKKDCGDNNACTVDNCVAGLCKNDKVPLQDTNCEDGDKCTENDLCKDGTCTGGGAVGCDDGDTCTADGCAKASGCTHATLADNTPCNDGVACTIQDLCQTGSCKGKFIDCDDKNPCTDDICGAVGCEHKNQFDTTACGVGLWCVSGVCKTKGCGDGYLDGNSGEQCDDGNTAACDACEGCQTRGVLTLDGMGWAAAEVLPTAPQSFKGDLGLGRDLTIEAWIRPDTIAKAQTIAAKGQLMSNPRTAWELSITATAGKLTFYHLGPEGGELVTATGSVVAGKWQHVAVVVAGDKVRFYIDGKGAGSGTLIKPHADAPAVPAVIGRRFADVDGVSGFVGAIDAVRLSTAPMYGGAFVPARTPAATPETRAIWLFDDPKAAMKNGLYSSDASPYGNTLLLKGSANLGADTCYGASASAALCGDGQVAPFEACDDKNADPCDGCAQCQVARTFAAGGVNSVVSSAALSSWAPDSVCATCEITLEAWVRIDQLVAGARQIVGTSGTFLSLQSLGGKFAVVRYPAAPLFSTDPYVLGKWYHVAVVASWAAGSELRLYVDGVLQPVGGPMPAPGPNDPPLAPGPELLAIGSGASSVVGGLPVTPAALLPGAVDEVRVSAGARYTDSFVPPKRVLPDAISRGIWRFDEVVGAVAFADDSGNGVAVTANKAVWGTDGCWGQGNAWSCGDSQPAKFEACDNGGGNGPPPKVCSAVCTSLGDADCSAMTYPGTGTILYNIMEYNSSAWTVDGWVRLPALPASGTGFIVGVADAASGCGQPTGQEWYLATTSNGSDASVLGGQTQIISPTKRVWRTGVWQHFALQYEGAKKGSLWVDGVKVRTFTNVSTAWGVSCPLMIGNNATGKALGGSLASLRLSAKARYGQTFEPPWTLAEDASTKWRFDFANPGPGATQILSTNTKYFLNFKNVTPSFESDGPKCK